MDESNDTDSLIALVSSLLPNASYSTSAILEALVLCEGNVTEAARSLTQPDESEQSKARGKKRRLTDLDAWLKPSKHSTPQKRKKSSLLEAFPRGSSPPKAVMNLMSAPPNPSPQKVPVTKAPSSPPSNSTSSPTKPVANLMDVLRHKDDAPAKVPRLRPMILGTPTLVESNTPCTLHLSILPPELACKLFYTMVDASKTWKRNKWWLFDRVVESPHRTSFFARRGLSSEDDRWKTEAARYWYNGRESDPPEPFPDAMEEACQIVETVVNDVMRKRKRFPLEWGGFADAGPIWKANVAASNCYDGSKESVGFHSDQLTYLGPYPTIASLSLGTQRMFTLREVIPNGDLSSRKAQTFNIPLVHNSLTIMHASCQERFKHSIPPQPAIDAFRPSFPKAPHSSTEVFNCRINITFRFYRPDFRPSSIPKCKCDIPTALRADMKNRNDGQTDRYWWSCYAGAQNEGKGCGFWKVMDMKAEGRGPCVRPLE